MPSEALHVAAFVVADRKYDQEHTGTKCISANMAKQIIAADKKQEKYTGAADNPDRGFLPQRKPVAMNIEPVVETFLGQLGRLVSRLPYGFQGFW